MVITLEGASRLRVWDENLKECETFKFEGDSYTGLHCIGEVIYCVG